MGAVLRIALALLAAGCLEPHSNTCADGRTCPDDTTCDVANHLCAIPTQIAACDGREDGNACGFIGTNASFDDWGVCSTGTCLPTTWTPAVISNAGVLGSARGLAIDARGTVYVADAANHRIERLDAAGVVTPVAGTGVAGSGGDGGAALAAQLDGPMAVAFDRSDTLYIADTNNNRIRRVTMVDPVDASTWTIAAFAGDAAGNQAGFAEGPGASARFRGPRGLYFDASTNELYVADTFNHVIRTVDPTTTIVTVVAGTAMTLGFFGDDTDVATKALLYQPAAVTRCQNRDLFIADTGNDRVRRVAAATGVISTVLGDGSVSSAGEGVGASIFPVDAPNGLACDPIGDLYVTSTTTVREVSADSTGVVDGQGLALTSYTAPPGPAAQLTGLAIVDATHVQVGDAMSGLVLELERTPQ